MFHEEVPFDQDGRVSWEEFRNTLDRLKSKMAQKTTNAKEYTSFNKMKADRFKHKRMGNELQDKYKLPVTFNQSVGFYHNDEIGKEISKQPKYPINKCPETKYAEEMIKTGIHFS